MNHAFNRNTHERGRVERDHVLILLGEVLRELLHLLIHQVRSQQRVSARGQLNRKTGGRLAVKEGRRFVHSRAFFNAGHVA